MRIAVIVSVAALSFGCASSSSIEVEKPAELVEFTAERKAMFLWEHGIGEGAGKAYLHLGPRLDGEVIYIAGRAGQVSALRAADGKRIWRIELDVPVSAAVGLGDGLVLVGTDKGKLIALEQRSGARRWEATLPTEILAPATAQRGVVVAQTGDGKVVALSASSGKKLWTFERSEPALSLRGTSSPLILGQYVITGFANGKIVALEISDGRLAWELPVAQPRGRNEIERLIDIDAPLLVVGGSLYAASYQGKIVAVDLQSGRLNWSRDASVFNAMDADSQYIYLSDDKGMVTALDQKTGTSVWRQEKLRGRRVSAPTRVGENIAVGDFEGYVHWLARDDGRFVARLRVSGDPILSTAVAQRGVLFVSDQSGALAAVTVQ